MALKNYVDLTGLGHFRDKILSQEIKENSYTLISAGTSKNPNLQYYTKSGTSYTAVNISTVPDVIPFNTYYTINNGSQSDTQHAPSVLAFTDFTKTYVDYVIEHDVGPLIDAKVSSVQYGTTTISGNPFTGIYTTNGTTHAVVAVDSTSAGTHQSTDLITSGAVNAGFASIALEKESVSNKVTSISSSSTNTQYPSAKAVYDAIQGIGPGTGNVDDVKLNGTSVVTNRVAVLTADITAGGTSGSSDLITSGAVNEGLASVDAAKADKASTVSTVDYDSANHKLTKTINGTTTDVVVIDNTSGGTKDSLVPVTSGAVNEGFASLNAAKINKDVLTSKGDIIYASASSTPTVLSIGTEGQVLKVDANGAPVWGEAGGNVDDVRINGTSIVSDKIANIAVDTTAGGTGASTDLITSGAVNAGLAAIAEVIEDADTTPGGTSGSVNLITSGAVNYGLSSLNVVKLDKAGGTISGNITPNATGTINLGSSSLKFKEVWADEVHVSNNTLYVGDTPVLSKEGDTITINGSNVRISSDSITMDSSTVSLPTGALSIDNLVTTGDVTSLNSTNTVIKDNMMIINYGEESEGVSSGVAGIQIDRGSLPDYIIEFDESDDTLKSGVTGSLQAIASQSYVTDAISSKANINSPTFTGVPSAPTAAVDTNTTQIATTAFVNAQISSKGAVTGPSSSVDSRVAVFNGTTGKSIKDSGFTIAKSVPADAVFTDTKATVSVTGSGNAITNITASNGALTATKGTTFLTSHQDISGKVDKSTLTTKGDIYYASAASTPTRLGIGTSGQVLKVNSSGVPYWGTDNDTTYSSKAAASSGTDVSLVTTGEKYTWNNKANAFTVTNSAPTLAWDTTSTVGTVAGTNLTVKMPANPNVNYYPTAFAWTGGTTAGPTGSLTGTGMSAVSFGAIPSASASASGVVTTGTQTIAGAKTFSSALTCSSTITGTEVYNAVWNDIADFLEVDEDTEVIYGRAYTRNKEGKVVLANNCKALGIASDTYGFGVGHKQGKTEIPIGIGGWVLAYVDKVYDPMTPLKAGENGVLTELLDTDRDYLCLGFFDRTEPKEEWGVSDRLIKVNGRCWVKIK